MHEHIPNSVKSAFNLLLNSQEESGAFQNICWLAADPSEYFRYDSVFLTSVVLSATRLLEGRDVRNARAKAIAYLESARLPFGGWRYWNQNDLPELPADLDDSACISEEIRFFYGNNKLFSHLETPFSFFYNNRNQSGLFKTWAESDQMDDIDSVVVANVINYLGSNHETKPSIDYLINIINNNKENDSHWYYPHVESLYHSVSRAYRSGVREFEATRANIINKIIAATYNSPLQRALAISTLSNYNGTGAVYENLISELLNSQNKDGGWDAEVYYIGPAYPEPKTLHFGSTEFVTAIAILALANVAGIMGDCSTMGKYQI